MKKLSKETRLRVLEHYKPSISSQTISDITGVSKTSVLRILRENKNVLLTQKGGRKKKLSLRKEKWLASSFNKKEFSLASDGAKALEKDFNIKVSTETIRKSLKTHGIHCHDRKKKPFCYLDI